ncbi:hypothetical protein QFC21_006769 [Naganishia friedmannii]|uniref:Uncharacterized protein n=1 Tax=Naganishia friedmannii TaxID=89922 RepID=A0ACC2V0C8_9TREE|nr:hypothetical protein QFC21_006769 [Naganishia friedmannii]
MRENSNSLQSSGYFSRDKMTGEVVRLLDSGTAERNSRHTESHTENKSLSLRDLFTKRAKSFNFFGISAHKREQSDQSSDGEKQTDNQGSDAISVEEKHFWRHERRRNPGHHYLRDEEHRFKRRWPIGKRKLVCKADSNRWEPGLYPKEVQGDSPGDADQALVPEQQDEEEEEEKEKHVDALLLAGKKWEEAIKVNRYANPQSDITLAG